METMESFAIFPIIFITVFLAIFITAFALIIPAVKRAFSKVSPAIDEVGKAAQAAVNGVLFNENSICNLNDREAYVLPSIKTDFPDFNAAAVKNFAKDAVRMKLSSKEGLFIHKSVISDYIKTPYSKSVMLQAALQYLDNGIVIQKRYILKYSNSIDKDKAIRNCPNCGAPISNPSLTVCEYCESLLFPTDNRSWQFAEVYEG